MSPTIAVDINFFRGEEPNRTPANKRKLYVNDNCKSGESPDGALKNIKHQHDARDLFK